MQRNMRRNVRQKMQQGRRFLLLVLVCGLAAVAGGCGGGTEKITLAGGSLAGAWSAISEGVANTLRREMPGFAITHEVGADGANAALVDSGRVQLGMLHSAMGQLGLRGEYPYAGKLENLRAISRIYSDSALHFVVRADTGITSFEQIREDKMPIRLSVMYRGSLMETASKALLEAYGITYEDIEGWGGRVYFRALVPSLQLMRDGGLDAISLVVQYPENNMTEASLTQRFRLLPVSEEVIGRVNERLGTYRSVIPAGTYRFAEQEVTTFSDDLVMIATAELNEQRAYEITRALYNNLDYLHSVHRALRSLTPEIMPRVNRIPLHPGAARFYREAGVLP